MIGRLWRVFKIIEEFSSGAEDELEEMSERIALLEQKNDQLTKENQELRFRGDRSATPGH